MLPTYLSSFISLKRDGQYSLPSREFYTLSVPDVRTELWKREFGYSAPSDWNFLQNVLKVKDLISLNAFKSKLKDLEKESSRCCCFSWCCCYWFHDLYWTFVLLAFFCHYLLQYYLYVLCLFWLTCSLFVLLFCVGQDSLEKEIFNLNGPFFLFR